MRATAALFFLIGLAMYGCAREARDVGSPRPDVLIDIESYAIASCLVSQSNNRYLADQGDAWAAAIVQRAKGDIDPLLALAETVKLEVKKGKMAVARDEINAGRNKELPVLYCNEIIDTPSIRTAIRNTVVALSSSYQQ